MSKFQLILTGLFIAFIIMGVLVFAFTSGKGVTPSNITVWGTVPQEVFTSVLGRSPLAKDKTVVISYVEKTNEAFNKDFIEALASGEGPDVVFLSQDQILKNKGKLYTIPYSTITARDYKDTFIQESELFMNDKGVVALPVYVDPMVLYWNRDVFNNAGIAQPPAFWDQFYTLSQQLTVKDGALNISKATIALGGYKNVTNAKDIIATLIMQAGNPIIANISNTPRSTLPDYFDQPVAPAVSALTFYTEFSNPAKQFYSWNPSLPDSINEFISGDLATYIGFASELYPLRAKNPNLNFDVTALPQTRNTGTKLTFGRIQGAAIVKTSRHIAGAYTVVSGLTATDTMTDFASTLHLSPTRRALLVKTPSNPYQSVFNQSALYANGWRDPDTLVTDQIFERIVSTITSGQVRIERAINSAHYELQDLISKMK